MTKKTNKYICEFAWLIVQILPLIGYLIAIRSNVLENGTLLTFESFMNKFLGFFAPHGSIINITLEQVFGKNGLLPIMSQNVINYVTYFIAVEIIHLIADVLLFIVRLAHKWLDGFISKTQGD